MPFIITFFCGKVKFKMYFMGLQLLEINFYIEKEKSEMTFLISSYSSLFFLIHVIPSYV